MISIGPLLGIEGDNEYTIAMMLDGDVNVEEMELVTEYIENGDKKISRHKFHFNEKLLNNNYYRFSFTVAKLMTSYAVSYKIELSGKSLSNASGDNLWKFVVPGKENIPKIGFCSCNGSSELLPGDMEQKDFVMWERLLLSHNKEGLNYSFHCLLLSGDQIYADPIWDEVVYFSDKKLLGWNSTEKIASHKIKTSELARLRQQVQAFYEDLYIQCWSRPEVSKVLASIPTIMMWDDHDIFDGWGSHSNTLQHSEIFKLIFEVAKKYFELFQIRTRENKALMSSNHHYSQRVSFRNYEIIVLDNRSHRTDKQIMDRVQYQDLHAIKGQNLFATCPTSLRNQRVLLFVIPVPIAHLDYKRRAEKWLKWFFRSNFRNSLNDDGLDHWDHENHKQEQQKLVELMYDIADEVDPKYVHVISGDVHSAGAGRIVRTTGTKRHINQLISSAVVHKPIGKVRQLIVDWASNEKSGIPGYTIQVDKFGVGKNPPMTIYERNFGFLYKAKGSGIKFYLTLEHDHKNYQWDQPRQYK